MLEVPNADSRLHCKKGAGPHYEWDPPIEPYDHYGPGNDFGVITNRQRSETRFKGRRRRSPDESDA